MLYALLILIAANEPAQPPSTNAPPGSNYMFCASTSAVPGTNNAYISNIFITDRSTSAMAADFNSYAQSQGYPVSFICQASRARPVLQEQFDGMLEVFDDHHYNIVQLQRIK
jgi:hypothetical protein